MANASKYRSMLGYLIKFYYSIIEIDNCIDTNNQSIEIDLTSFVSKIFEAFIEFGAILIHKQELATINYIDALMILPTPDIGSTQIRF